MSYAGRGGHYWDKSSCITSSRGEYHLGLNDTTVFGAPVRLMGTGTTDRTYRQRLIHSYNVVAGSLKTIGVVLEDRDNVSAWTAADRALHKGREYERDMTVILRGPVQIQNVGSGEIDVQMTVIPAFNGCEIMTASGQFSLGKSMQKIPSLYRGLVFVDPDYEKPQF